MKKTFLTIFLCSLMAQPGAHAQDMAGIERLLERDVAATLSGDPKVLADLWTDDAVRLMPGGQAEIGKRIITAKDERERAEHSGRKVLSYAPDIKEIRMADGWAFEWGYFTFSYKDSPDDQVRSFRGKLLRVLQK